MKQEQPKQVQRAIANGSMNRVNELTSLAMLLSYEVSRLTSETEEILNKNGLSGGTLMLDFESFEKVSNRLFKSILETIRVSRSEKRMALLRDSDAFHLEMLTKFNLKNYREWKDTIFYVKDKMYREQQMKQYEQGNNNNKKQ